MSVIGCKSTLTERSPVGDLDTPATLKNPLRVLDIWALGVGIVVCGQYFGWNLGLLGGGPVGMLLASLIICLLFLVWVLTLAELAVAMPRAGGPLDYGQRAGGPWLGFLMAWSMLLECLFGTIATALSTAWYVAFLLNPEQPDPNVVVWAGLGTIVLFLLLQSWGVKEQSKALILMTYAAILGLVIFWLVSGSNFSWKRAWPRSDLLIGKGWKSVLEAIPYALWWLIIIEGVALAAEETHQPHRSIPRGLVWAMVTVIAMVILTLGLTAGAVPWQTVEGEYPLAKVVLDVTEGKPTWLIYGFGSIALFGLIASYHGLLYSTSRQAFALGRSGFLPEWLGGIHAARRTPVPALLACSLITSGFVLASVWFKDAINVAILVAGLASLILYILSMVCLVSLRRREPGLFHAYRAPLGRLLPVAVVLLAGFAIFVYAGIKDGDTVLALGAALYAIGLGYFGYRRAKRAIPGASPTEPVNAIDASRREPQSPWLDRVAGVALVAALLVIAWIGTSAYLPDWFHPASIETEIVICVIILGAALGSVCGVAIAHTRSRDER